MGDPTVSTKNETIYCWDSIACAYLTMNHQIGEDNKEGCYLERGLVGTVVVFDELGQDL